MSYFGNLNLNTFINQKKTKIKRETK